MTDPDACATCPDAPRRRQLGMVCVLVAALPLTATAQQDDAAQKLVAIVGIDSATVAPGGLGFASLAVTSRRDDGTDADNGDGSLALGFGLGSAEDAIGVQFTVFATSLTDDFGDSGSFAVKASRRIATGPVPVYVSLGFDDLNGWGDADDVDERATLALSGFSRVTTANGAAFPLMFTLGVGSNLVDDNTETGVFGGIGVGINRSLGLSAAWTGEAVDLATAFRVDGLDNLAFTAAVNDVFDQEDSLRVTVSVSYFLRDLF